MPGHLRVRQHIYLQFYMYQWSVQKLPEGGGRGVYKFLASRNEIKYALLYEKFCFISLFIYIFIL